MDRFVRVLISLLLAFVMSFSVTFAESGQDVSGQESKEQAAAEQTEDASPEAAEQKETRQKSLRQASIKRTDTITTGALRQEKPVKKPDSSDGKATDIMFRRAAGSLHPKPSR